MKLRYKQTTTVDSVATGVEARKYRQKRLLALCEVARAMHKSATFLCDLEYGRRNWTPELLKAFKEACDK